MAYRDDVLDERVAARVKGIIEKLHEWEQHWEFLEINIPARKSNPG